ncbi:hypothetical protein J3A83DRAFT_1826497 [Scleroderma citrinum]
MRQGRAKDREAVQHFRVYNKRPVFVTQTRPNGLPVIPVPAGAAAAAIPLVPTAGLGPATPIHRKPIPIPFSHIVQHILLPTPIKSDVARCSQPHARAASELSQPFPEHELARCHVALSPLPDRTALALRPFPRARPPRPSALDPTTSPSHPLALALQRVGAQCLSDHPSLTPKLLPSTSIHTTNVYLQLRGHQWWWGSLAYSRSNSSTPAKHRVTQHFFV